MYKNTIIDTKFNGKFIESNDSYGKLKFKFVNTKVRHTQLEILVKIYIKNNNKTIIIDKKITSKISTSDMLKIGAIGILGNNFILRECFFSVDINPNTIINWEFSSCDNSEVKLDIKYDIDIEKTFSYNKKLQVSNEFHKKYYEKILLDIKKIDNKIYTNFHIPIAKPKRCCWF